MNVGVDRTRCQGHNRCLAIAPDLFDIDDAGYAVVIGDGAVGPDQAEDAELAADNCPEQAISIG
jgi:ferredoxin